MLTGDSDGSADCVGGFSGAIDRDRITGVFGIEADVGVESETLRDTVCQMADGVFQLIPNGAFKAAEGSPDHADSGKAFQVLPP